MALQEAMQMYRHTLRASRAFTDYNFRHYFARRAREDFRALFGRQSQADEPRRQAFLEQAKTNLEMLKRQSVISQMYTATPPTTQR
ncbi:ISD11 [Symbiodinium sp. CCMP2592]|nr:ISD11 [Symbiodinium sp. CCMP2592]